jgi:hypothetical protein
MCLALAYVCTELARVRRARTVVALAGVALVLSFTFYYPLLTKVPISRAAWLRRIWVFDQCERPGAATVATISDGTAIGSTAEPEGRDVEPEGWCWI